MQKKEIFFAGAVVCLLAAGWGYYEYQKPRAGVLHIKPAFELTAPQLFAEYTADEAAADKKYGGQVLQVSGVVADVQHTAQTTNILLASGAAAGGVNCSMGAGGPTDIQIGNPIKLKGRCTGFLMDVNLVDAVRIRD